MELALSHCKQVMNLRRREVQSEGDVLLPQFLRSRFWWPHQYCRSGGVNADCVSSTVTVHFPIRIPAIAKAFRKVIGTPNQHMKTILCGGPASVNGTRSTGCPTSVGNSSLIEAAASLSAERFSDPQNGFPSGKKFSAGKNPYSPKSLPTNHLHEFLEAPIMKDPNGGRKMLAKRQLPPVCPASNGFLVLATLTDQVEGGFCDVVRPKSTNTKLGPVHSRRA